MRGFWRSNTTNRDKGFVEVFFKLARLRFITESEDTIEACFEQNFSWLSDMRP
jgi:hypothetical protein